MCSNIAGVLAKGWGQLRRFVEVDDHEAVKIGDLERNLEAIKVVRPRLNKVILLNSIIRVAVGEKALRTGEEGMLRMCINTTSVVDDSWGPRLVGEDWHAVCQAIYRGVEGAEWETLYNKFVDMKGRSTSAAQADVVGQPCSGK